MSKLPRHLAALAALAGLLASAFAADPVDIKISVLPGLKYDVPRFAVAPGAAVKITLRNPDQMIHNLVITQPGARMEIVLAALALGADGPAKDFVPESPKVLVHTRALNPGQSQELAFTAPAAEGVYPYVCTFTGHGVVMYGAMYVTTKPLPPLETDPNLPPVAAAIADASDHSHHALEKPVISRTFLPDCGPAAIAVGFPGGQSFCFDAGTCQLRYVWSGGFVDNGEHWNGKGETMGKIVGRIYYRGPFGDISFGSEAPKAARWRGYEIHDGIPQLEFTLSGHLVKMTARPLPEGQKGLAFTYEVDAPGERVAFGLERDLVEGEIEIAGGRPLPGVDRAILFKPEEKKRFTFSLVEHDEVEPLRYYSFNDLVFPGNKTDPAPGVVGRAFTPGGTDSKAPKKFDTGLHLADLAGKGTILGWYKVIPDKKKTLETYPIFGAGKQPLVEAITRESAAWQHVALTFGADERHVYRNGVIEPSADIPVDPALLPETITIGSAGDTFLKGLIDEVRIYDRTLAESEIRRLYEREAARLPRP